MADEYIEREALLNNRPEGRNLGQVGKEEYNKGWNDCRRAFFECIEEEPAADVAPVIYCRNCKHRGTDECPMYHEETVSWQNKDLMPEWDVIAHDFTRDDGFCDRGDRKDGE